MIDELVYEEALEYDEYSEGVYFSDCKYEEYYDEEYYEADKF